MGYPLLDLTIKTAVVIGGTSGIGLALIKALAQAGGERYSDKPPERTGAVCGSGGRGPWVPIAGKDM